MSQKCVEVGYVKKNSSAQVDCDYRSSESDICSAMLSTAVDSLPTTAAAEEARA
jgi:hypothetical protein